MQECAACHVTPFITRYPEKHHWDKRMSPHIASGRLGARKFPLEMQAPQQGVSRVSCLALSQPRWTRATVYPVQSSGLGLPALLEMGLTTSSRHRRSFPHADLEPSLGLIWPTRTGAEDELVLILHIQAPALYGLQDAVQAERCYRAGAPQISSCCCQSQRLGVEGRL